jgi:hypothetical protein
MDTTTETYRQRIERETAEATELVWRLKDDPMWRITNWTNRTAMAVFLGGESAPGRCLYAVVADCGSISVWRVGMSAGCVESFSLCAEPSGEAFASALDYIGRVTA